MSEENTVDTESETPEVSPAENFINAVTAKDYVAASKEFEEMMQERIPLGRPQTSEDMGHAALYLASANNVTGVSLSVSGGFEVN